MLRVGVIGYGYWGPNIVRCFSQVNEVQVTHVCDNNPDALHRAQRLHPGLAIHDDYRDLVAAEDVDAVAIVTPVSTHYALARAALERDKHVFIEKPFVSSSAEGEELTSLAARRGLRLMVDHTFLFTGAVRKVKEIVDRGDLGTLFYYDSTRVNLGLFQHDVNVVWDLAPHDLSIIDHIAGKRPLHVIATGFDHLKTGQESLAHITVEYEDDLIAHLHLNWMSPVKARTTLIGGSRQMLIWDDLKPDEKIKVYNSGVEVSSPEDTYQLKISYRAGDMWSPRTDTSEALLSEATYFKECVAAGVDPHNDGQAGLRIVRLLEACDRSLHSASRRVAL